MSDEIKRLCRDHKAEMRERGGFWICSWSGIPCACGFDEVDPYPHTEPGKRTCPFHGGTGDVRECPYDGHKVRLIPAAATSALPRAPKPGDRIALAPKPAPAPPSLEPPRVPAGKPDAERPKEMPVPRVKADVEHKTVQRYCRCERCRAARKGTKPAAPVETKAAIGRPMRPGRKPAPITLVRVVRPPASRTADLEQQILSRRAELRALEQEYIAHVRSVVPDLSILTPANVVDVEPPARRRRGRAA